MAKRHDTTEMQTPPHNLDMERASLGCCIGANDAIAVLVARGVEPSDYYSSAHQRIYSAILYLWSEGQPVDMMTVYEALRHTDQIEEIGGMAYLAALEEYVTTTTNVRAYADTIIEHSVRRAMIEAHSQALHSLYSDNEPVDDLMGRIDRQMITLKKRLLTKEAIEMSSIPKHIDVILARRAGNMGMGVPTGLIDLDCLLFGLQPSDLIILAARPSMGKTACALGIARNAAEQGLPVDIFSLEMSADQLKERWLSSTSRIDLGLIRSGHMSNKFIDCLRNAASWLAQLPIYIEDEPALQIRDLCAIAEERKRKHGIRLIVVDYLQLVHAPSSIARMGRFNVVSHVSSELKALARRLNVPVLACCQLKRSADDRPGRRPELSDLKESGNIEQDADVVFALWRDTSNDPEFNKPQPVKTQCAVLKQRNGPTAHLMNGLWFHRQTTTFFSVAKDDPDVPPSVIPDAPVHQPKTNDPDDEIPFFGLQGPPQEDNER